MTSCLDPAWKSNIQPSRIARISVRNINASIARVWSLFCIRIETEPAKGWSSKPKKSNIHLLEIDMQKPIEICMVFKLRHGIGSNIEIPKTLNLLVYRTRSRYLQEVEIKSIIIGFKPSFLKASPCGLPQALQMVFLIKGIPIHSGLFKVMEGPVWIRLWHKN